jgi:hypothetical protein
MRMGMRMRNKAPSDNPRGKRKALSAAGKILRQLTTDNKLKP